MTERKEPTINSIRPEPDEIARRQRQAAAARGAQARGSAAPVVVRSKLAPVAFLVALLGCGAAGYLYWQNMQFVLALQTADARILELEKQLEMTGDESTASMTAVQAKLKWADSEIRKLWGVAHDRNRKAIAANADDIAALKKGAGSVDGKIKAALQGPVAEIKLINDLLDAQQSAISQVESKSQQQLTQVQDATDKLRQLEKTEAELKRRIAANEEAITAIDAFRRQVNQQLLQMRGATP